MVPLAGLEPACLSAFDFESNASTNFATGARRERQSLDDAGAAGNRLYLRRDILAHIG